MSVRNNEETVEDDENTNTSVLSLSDSITLFSEDYLLASVTERVSLLRKISAKLSDVSECNKSSDFNVLFIALMKTLHRYPDRTSKLVVGNVLQRLCAAFPQESLKTIPKIMEKLTVNNERVGVLGLNTLLNWSVAFVRGVGQDALIARPNDFQSIVQSQAKLVGLIYSTSHYTSRKHCRSAVMSVLRDGGKAIADAYLSVLGSQAKASAITSALGGIVIDYCKQLGHDDVINKHLPAMIKLYMDTVVTQKTLPPVNQCLGFRSVLATLSIEDYTKEILPATLKSLLRNSAVGTVVLTCQLKCIDLDLSHNINDFMSAIRSTLNHKEQTVRESAVELCAVLAPHLSSPASLCTLTSSLVDMISGRGPVKVSVWAHKVCVMEGLAAVANNSPDTTRSEVAGEVLASLLASAEKEPNENVFQSEFNCIAMWLKHLDVVPSVVCDKFVKDYFSPKAKAINRLACLKALSNSVSAKMCTDATWKVLVPKLCTVVDTAVAKPTPGAVIEAAYASHCLLVWTSDKDCSVALPLKSGDLTTSIVNMSIFNNEKLLMNAEQEDQIAIARLSDVMVQRFTHALSPESPWLSIILRLSISEYVAVRRISLGSILAAVRAKEGSYEHFKSLLSAFQSIFLNSEKTPYPRSNLYMLTATAICSVNPAVPAEIRQKIAISALLVFHHPYIGSLKAYQRVLRSSKIEIGSLISERMDEVITLTTGETGVGSENRCSQLAALAAIRTLLTHAGDISVLPYLKWALANLNSERILSVDEYQNSVYHTPEGQLFDNEIIESIRRSQVPTSRPTKNGKGKADLEEEAWAKKLRDDQARKKGDDPNAIKLTAHQKEQVEAVRIKESVIRANVSTIANEAARVLSILLVICAAKPAQLQSNVPMMLTILSPLLTSPLVGDRAQQVWYSLIGCLDKRFISTCKPILVCQYTLQQLVTKENATKADDEELKKGVGAVITTLFMATAGTRSLANPEFSFCFELLKSVLACPIPAFFSVSVQRQALGLAKRHLPVVMKSELYPRHDLINLLLHVAATYDHLQSQATDSIVMIGSETNGQLDNNCTELLLSGVTSPVSAIRMACLKAFEKLPFEEYDVDDEYYDLAMHKITPYLFVLRFDVDEEIKELAQDVCDDKALELTSLDELEIVARLVETPVAAVQQSSVKALSAGLDDLPEYTSKIVGGLLERIPALLFRAEPVFDDCGNMISEPFVDPWQARVGVAMALNNIAANIQSSELQTIMTVLTEYGFPDVHPSVRKEMLSAASKLIDVHGASAIDEMLPVMEATLARTNDSHQGGDDEVHEATIICMGAMARHLEKTDPKVPEIIGQLLEALKTPSMQVQEAVAKCLPPLIPTMKDQAGDLVKTLMAQLLEGSKFSERKGAAYGLAGVVKGLGILSLKQHDIVNNLMEAVQNKKSVSHREGGLMAFETLVSTLGRLFEPYVIRLLPHLLVAFGDNNENVRYAANDTAAAIIRHLSESSRTGPGVKLVLPALMRALDDKQWRTKQGATEMLGAMSACAPDQLSSSLPQIVPRLAEVLTDSHPKVQEAGKIALNKIGGVIKNPEIQEIVSVLLDALVDPDGKTQKCLTTLLDTNFVHFIDAPSLALIMPVLHRALKQRSTETKMWAAQIIGNMSSLTNHKDLSPYLPIVLPGLREVLVDSSPAVREVSARALGTMVQGMGEECFSELIPWLVETLKSPGNSAVDRSGAAQGLSEVLYGLGTDRLERLLPDIIANCSAKEAYTREGFMMVLFFTPSSFGDDLLPFVPVVIPPILKGLADEAENVRHAALKAGQMIVNNYAESAVEILLPELEKGLFDDNWRIRQSSIHLLGDLLYRISGQSGAKTTESGGDDDNFGTTEAREALVEVLGEDRLRWVFAGLYMGRSDVSPVVRQASLHIWKVVVHNTARTLRDIMPTLMQLLLKSLSSPNHDRRRIAAQTMGDIVLKMGDYILPEIVPIIAEGLSSEDSSTRCGVCVGLSEVMNAAMKDSVLLYVSSIIPVVRQSLMDLDGNVREAAAKTFDTLFSVIGNKAVDEVLPSMLRALDSEDEEVSESALLGLRQVMKTQSQVVLPFLVPKLASEPVSEANAHALAALAVVSGSTLNTHLSTIVPALLNAICLRNNASESILASFEQIVLCLETKKGQSIVLGELMEMLGHRKAVSREIAANLIVTIADSYDIENETETLLSKLLYLFNDPNESCVLAGWNAANSVAKTVPKEDQDELLPMIRKTISIASHKKGSRDLVEELPGFNLPKGISPILPMFLHGLIYGSPETREVAAAGLGDIISLTSTASLKPFVIQITGPLIRVVADRFAWQVKAAIIDTLMLLLRKASVQLKAFLPQLQTTFLKALVDHHEVVRKKAAMAFQPLAAVHNRIDALVPELCTGVRDGEGAQREAMLLALSNTILGGSAKFKEVSTSLVLTTLMSVWNDSNEQTRTVSAKCVGYLGAAMNDLDLNDILNSEILTPTTAVGTQYRNVCTLAAMLMPEKGCAPRVWTNERQERIETFIVRALESQNLDIAIIALEAVGNLLTYLTCVEGHTSASLPTSIIPALVLSMQGAQSEQRHIGCAVVTKLAKASPDFIVEKDIAVQVVPALLMIAREKQHMFVKREAERALVHCLRLREGEWGVDMACQALDAKSSAALKDYAARVLTPVVDITDDEQ
eukprot:CFRG1397T1